MQFSSFRRYPAIERSTIRRDPTMLTANVGLERSDGRSSSLGNVLGLLRQPVELKFAELKPKRTSEVVTANLAQNGAEKV
jgi:hypothetical protein